MSKYKQIMTYLERREPLYFHLVLWIHQMIPIYFFTVPPLSLYFPLLPGGVSGSHGSVLLERGRGFWRKRPSGAKRARAFWAKRRQPTGWGHGTGTVVGWKWWRCLAGMKSSKVPSTFESWRFFGGYDLGRYVLFQQALEKTIYIYIYHEISHKMGPPR